MADSTEWAPPAEINAAAGGGLILTVQAVLPATVSAANWTREAAYQELLIAAAEMRRLLTNIDPQADASVLTAVSATLATL